MRGGGLVTRPTAPANERGDTERGDKGLTAQPPNT